MALIKLTKVDKRPQDACFIVTLNNGEETHTQIPLSEYPNVSQEMVDSLGIKGVFHAAYTRYDYETPTGLLSDGEYGDAGVNKDGTPVIHTVVDGKYEILPKTVVSIDDYIDTADPVVLSNKSTLTKK